jgi:hypothetical protein
VFDGLILETIFHLLAHDFPGLGVGPFSFGDAADRYITIGDHSDQLVVLADRQHPDIQLLHRRRRVAKRLVRANNLDITMHDLVDLHANLLELPS